MNPFGVANDFLKAKVGLNLGQLWGLSAGLLSIRDTLKSDKPKSDKLREAGIWGAVTLLSLNSEKFLAQNAISLAGMLALSGPGVAKSLATSFKGSMNNRTMAAIPFSFSNVPMEIANASMNQAMQRTNDARMFLGGNTASLYASRYVSHH